jgi:hypothetical protein
MDLPPGNSQAEPAHNLLIANSDMKILNSKFAHKRGAQNIMRVGEICERDFEEEAANL